MCKNDVEEESDEQVEPLITEVGKLKQHAHQPKGGVPFEGHYQTPLHQYRNNVGSREDGGLTGDRPEEVNQQLPVIVTDRDSGRPKQAVTVKSGKLVDGLSDSRKPKGTGTVKNSGPYEELWTKEQKAAIKDAISTVAKRL